MISIDNMPLPTQFDIVCAMAFIACLFAIMMRELWDDPVVQHTGRALSAGAFVLLGLFGWHAVGEYQALEQRIRSHATQPANPMWNSDQMADMRIERGDTVINWNRNPQPTSFTGSQFQ